MKIKKQIDRERTNGKQGKDKQDRGKFSQKKFDEALIV
jgi:hypothetical protein